MDLQKAVTLAEQFVNDESYPIVARYNQNRQIFDVLDLNETGLSAVIAWLLNPAEGHGLNDFFIKSMLRGAITSEGYTNPVSILELESMNLHGLSVHKEYGLDGYERRIDILATDIDNKLVVVIEYKYGSGETNNQLAAYSERVEKKIESDPGYRVIRILMDGQEKTDRNKLAASQQDKWAIVSHSWLIDALTQAVEKDTGSDACQWILKDLLVHLSSCYELDNVYNSAIGHMAGMASRHQDLVDQYSEVVLATGENELNIWELDDIGLIGLNKQLEPGPFDQVVLLRKFFKTNATLLSTLAQYARLEWLQELLDKRFPGQLDCRPSDKKIAMLDIFQFSWAKFQKTDQPLWPFYLTVEQHRQEDGEEILIKFILQRSGVRNDELAWSIVDAFGRRVKSNWQYTTLFKLRVDDKSNIRENLLQELVGRLDWINSVLAGLH